MGLLHFDRKLTRDFEDLLGHYASDEFESPFRSTVPLLSLIQDGADVFAAVLAACEIHEPASIHLEYTVRSPRGKGKPSHTDVIVRATDETLAFKAKWSEPRYETVGKWLRDSKIGDNRWEVMAGWLQLLRPHGSDELRVDDFRDVVYQMLHRAASSRSMKERGQLAYLHFTPPPDRSAGTSDQYLADLSRLHGLLGNPDDFPFRLLEVEAAPTTEFAAIAGLPKGSPETSESVRRALCKGGLFDFAVRQVHSIP